MTNCYDIKLKKLDDETIITLENMMFKNPIQEGNRIFVSLPKEWGKPGSGRIEGSPLELGIAGVPDQFADYKDSAKTVVIVTQSRPDIRYEKFIQEYNK